MFKKLGVFGFVLAAAATSLIQPSAAYASDWGHRENGYSSYERHDGNRFRGDRDSRREYREWRERERDERREWRFQERHDRFRTRDYRRNDYGPTYYGNFTYSRPY